MKKTTVRVGSNIAFIKYWGVTDASLHLPLSNSISMTLADLYTTTTVEWDAQRKLTQDHIVLDGVQLDTQASQRLSNHLDRLRQLVGREIYAHVVSTNNFPMASGIASSASGFAALTVAGAKALGLQLTTTELSALARLGSGSASRSLFGGFVEWEQGHDHNSSVAFQLHDADHWPLHDIVAVVSSHAKKVSSARGHTMAASSPLNAGRIAYVNQVLPQVRDAISDRDLDTLGPILEQDAIAMHAVMMTGEPSLFYWQPGTLAVMQAVRQWREEEQLPVYFTMDAGPNVHLMCEEQDVEAICRRLAGMSEVERVISSGPGTAPQFLEQHLF